MTGYNACNYVMHARYCVLKGMANKACQYYGGLLCYSNDRLNRQSYTLPRLTSKVTRFENKLPVGLPKAQKLQAVARLSN